MTHIQAFRLNNTSTSVKNQNGTEQQGASLQLQVSKIDYHVNP